MPVAFVWELTKETIQLPLGGLQGGVKGLGIGAKGQDLARLDDARDSQCCRGCLL